MIVEAINKRKIIISFSSSVGKEGLNRIKKYIEFLEKNDIPKRKKVSQSVINTLANEVNMAVWERFKKAKGL